MKQSRAIAALVAVAMTFTIVGQAEAGEARMFADTGTASKLGSRGITPDVASPADLVLNSRGRAVAIFPTSTSGGKTKLQGGLSLRRGSRVIVIRQLRLNGGFIVGKLGGKIRPILRLKGSRSSGKRVSFKSANLSAPAARILRQVFTDSVFKAGMRFFESGRIGR